MWDQRQKALDFDGTTIKTINIKLEETKIILKSIFMNTFSAITSVLLMILKLFYFYYKTYQLDPTRREEFWRAKLKTLPPDGLNIGTRVCWLFHI